MRMSSIKSRLSYETKLKVINMLEENIKPRVICEKFGIKKSTVSKIKSRRDQILNFSETSHGVFSKIKKVPKLLVPDVEKALYVWFLQQRELNNLVNDELLQLKALEFHQTLNTNETFLASHGWVQRFKARHSIRLLKISGEKLSADESAIPAFKRNLNTAIREMGLCGEQIYNADETGLVYKSLNQRTLVARNERTAAGRKVFKERITVMPCVNSTGNHKIRLMAIGKSKKPRCFQGISLPDIHYRASKNAWQTRALFKEWFEDVFVPQVKTHLEEQDLPPKAILLLDNATCHLSEEELRTSDGNIQVKFLPPNTTSILQPLDQSIIKSLKQKYRKKLLSYLISQPGADVAQKQKSLNLKEVIFLITEAYNELSETTIKNGFKAVLEAEFSSLHMETDHSEDDDDVPLTTLFRRLLPDNAQTNEEIMDWASGQNENARTLNTDDEIVEQIHEVHEDVGVIDERDMLNEDNTIQHLGDPVQSMNIVIDYAETNLDIRDIMTLRQIREKIIRRKLNAA